MVLAVHKRAMGVFENSEDTKSAIHELKNSGFPMDNVVVATKDRIPDDKMLSPDSEFLESRTIESLGTGALSGAALGGIAGLFAGLTTLFMPDLGPISVTEPAATIAALTAGGSFFGAFGGAIVGTVAGDQVSEDKAKVYNHHLSQGHYIVRIDGTDEEIERAASILSDRGIQNWQVYQATEND